MSRREYPRYKESGVEWLGEVPEDWDTQRLKYCAQLINEKIEGSGTELPYLGLEHIESWTGKRIVTAEPSSSEGQSNRIRQGDVLFGKLRPYLAKVHRASEEGICTGELLVLKPKCVVQDFLFYYMLSKDFISVVDSSTYGAKMPRASWEFIGNLPTLVPSQNEQRAIAAFLDRETGRIDTLMEKKQRQIELLQEKRSALISHAVTKGLDSTVPLKDSGIEWMGQIPTHWELGKLKHITGSIQTGPFGSQLHAGEYVENGIPAINPSNLQNGKIVPDWRCCVDEGIFARLKRHRLDEGDIVFARRGEMGRCALITREEDGWLCGTGSIRIQLNKEDAYPAFVYQVLSTPGVRDWLFLESVGSTMENLNTEIMSRIPILLPPLDEQIYIVGEIEKHLQQIDNLKTKIQESLDRLKEYRTALISAAVTGRIDVREGVA